jgi:DNA-binding XRE family transcriptional regulator
MGKTFELSDMPALTLEMHNKLRALERDLRLALGNCCSSHDLVDREAAFEYVRTYAIKFFDCFYQFYSHIPDPTFRAHWRPASEAHAFQRVTRCISNDFHVELFFKNNPDRVAGVKKTICDHAERNAIPAAFSTMLTGKQAADYAAAGVDIASGSPLLIMMAAAARGAQRAEEETSLPAQIKRLQNECGISAEKMAEAVGIDPRSIYKHLAGQTVPRRNHITAYEKLFSERLNRPVSLRKSVKVSKSQRT